MINDFENYFQGVHTCRIDRVARYKIINEFQKLVCYLISLGSVKFVKNESS
jgi:hypothetical protein